MHTVLEVAALGGTINFPRNELMFLVLFYLTHEEDQCLDSTAIEPA